MSVPLPIIDFIDPVNRRIYLNSIANRPVSKIENGVLVWNPIDDIYTEVRNLRRTDESLRPFDMFCSALELIDKGGGNTTGRGLILLGGTRIIPFDEDQNQKITGELLSDEGISGTALLDTTLLSGSTKIKLSYEPPPATEVVTITLGSAVTAQDKTDIIDGVWNKTLP